GIIYLAVRWVDRPDAHAAAVPTARAAPSASDVAELRSELAQLRFELRVQGATQRAAEERSAVPAPAEAKDSRRDPEVAAEAERKHQAYLAGIESSFHDEARDPAWSATVATAI